MIFELSWPSMLSKLLYLMALSTMTIVCASGAPAPTSVEQVEAISSANSSIDWRSCQDDEFAHWFAPSEMTIDTLQCATIDIPLQYISSSSDIVIDSRINNQQRQTPTTIKLAISRLPATGNKIGSVINITGGPGQSGLNVSPIDSMAYAQLSSHFDIIGFAPRGVYPTTPAVICEPNRRTLAPEDPKAFAKGCWQHTPHDLLGQLGAEYAVTDIEAIRQALDEPKISLISYSYGTKIAALYAERYPEHLRAGVLDGVVNLNESELRMQMNQEASVQQTFERFVNECRRQPNCFFTDTATIKAAEGKIAKIYHYFDANDVLDFDGERITPAHLSWTFYGLMAWPDQWPLLNELLHQLSQQDFELLALLIEEDKNNIDYPTFAAIDCADRAPAGQDKALYLQHSKLIEAQSTWDNHREPRKDELLDACYYWPIAGSDQPHIPKLSPRAPTLLLVAQTNDPATPYANAIAMQQYLNAALLTRQGDGHTLVLGDVSQCVDDKVVRYLLDPDSFKKYAYTNRNHDLICSD